jgi:glycosyltransferase involved in cell wall biosynthesis
MRLVIATPLYPPEIGGPATYTKILEEGLPQKGIEVEVVKFSDVRHLPKFIRHYLYYRRVLRAARSADVVLALDPVSVGLPALKAAQKAGKPFVVKIVGDYAWEQGQQRFGVTQNLDEFIKTKNVASPVRVFRLIQTHVAESATRVIVPSEYLKGIVMAWGILAEHIQVIYNAVPLEEIGWVPESLAALPRPLVVTAGRLVPWKHMTGVIDAVASLRDTSLAIVGDGPDRMLLEQLAEKKLPGRHVFTGMLSHTDVLATVRSAETFVLNSSYEGLSHHLVEALALGVPTIATRVGGNPEVVTHEEDGLLIPVNDTAALAQALRLILTDDGLHTRLATRAKEAAKRFSVETLLTETTALLRSL